ncbi:MAG: hypothetical protein RL750_580 [Bacteroidota bacterium]|jgi:cell division protein FtsQ
MIRSINIKRILFILLWLGIATAMGFVLRAAWKKQDQAICKGYAINRDDNDSFVFVKRSDVERLIALRAGGRILGQPIDRFPLQAMEDSLETFVGVSDAQIYFDVASVLQVRVVERIPVARVFTTAGNSFYLDSLGSILPLSDAVVIQCPVFNGMKLTGNDPDSVQAKQVVGLAKYIQADSFWSAQVGHFEIDEKGRFEMIPLAGNHRVQFGIPDEPAAAFQRLWIFYQQVLRVQGLDRYARIDVRYRGQVVASQNRRASVIDSTQLRKQVEVLIDAGMKTDSASQLLKPIKRAT